MSEREDLYFTLAFNIAIRSVCFAGGDAAFAGSGGRRGKSRNDESEKDDRESTVADRRYRRGLGHAPAHRRASCALPDYFIPSKVFLEDC